MTVLSPHSWSSLSSSEDNNPAGVITTTPFKNAAAIGDESSLLCDECGAIPIQRKKCRKCKERYVCDICCSTKRGLELAWWCATCFGNESVASQELICSGDYDSDTDHDCLRVLDPLS